jgi:hypothetical protein
LPTKRNEWRFLLKVLRFQLFPYRNNKKKKQEKISWKMKKNGKFSQWTSLRLFLFSFNLVVMANEVKKKINTQKKILNDIEKWKSFSFSLILNNSLLSLKNTTFASAKKTFSSSTNFHSLFYVD